jgi:histone deacetylase complex regulatory component SIN3
VFFEKVKARLRNKDTYQDFLKCLNLFSQEIIGRTELHSLVCMSQRMLARGSRGSLKRLPA